MNLQRVAEHLTRDMNLLTKDAGKVVHAVAYGVEKGGGWVVVFSTEYAALKVFYAWRKAHSIHFGKGPLGWYVSKGERRG